MKFWSNVEINYFNKRVEDKFLSIEKIDKTTWKFKLDNNIYNYYIEFLGNVDEFKIICTLKDSVGENVIYDFYMVIGYDKQDKKNTFDIIKATEFYSNNWKDITRTVKSDRLLNKYKDIGNIATCFIKFGYCKI